MKIDLPSINNSINTTLNLKNLLLAVLLAFTFTTPNTEVNANEDGEELATYMGELQRLTHKLQLSIEANNPQLASFYLQESFHIYEEVQSKLPVYEDIPVAIYLDRFALPTYQPLRQFLSAKPKNIDPTQGTRMLNTIIEGCNKCHQVSHFGFVKIQSNSHNPYLQDFSPQQ